MLRVREQESGMYSPSVAVNTERLPAQRYQFQIGFNCNPDNIDKLIVSAFAEINKLTPVGPAEINVEKFKAEDRNNRK